MTVSGIPKGVRAHVSDAAFHLRQAHRSLDAAAAQAKTRLGERKLAALSSQVKGWMVELDPATHWLRERDRRRGRASR